MVGVHYFLHPIEHRGKPVVGFRSDPLNLADRPALAAIFPGWNR